MNYESLPLGAVYCILLKINTYTRTLTRETTVRVSIFRKLNTRILLSVGPRRVGTGDGPAGRGATRTPVFGRYQGCEAAASTLNRLLPRSLPSLVWILLCSATVTLKVRKRQFSVQEFSWAGCVYNECTTQKSAIHSSVVFSRVFPFLFVPLWIVPSPLFVVGSLCGI